MEELSENLLEMEKTLEVDYSELIHDTRFADGAQVNDTIEVSALEKSLPANIAESAGDDQRTLFVPKVIELNVDGLHIDESKESERNTQNSIRCCFHKCNVIFDSKDLSASSTQKLCALHYSDLIARAKLLSKMEAKGGQDGPDFDLPCELDDEQDTRIHTDEEPFDAGELIMGESELSKSFSINKVYSGPKTTAEIGRVLRDAHLNSKM